MLVLLQLPGSDLVRDAYALQIYEYAAPGWLAAQRFDINAKVPPGATKEDLKLMLQALLEVRFKLQYHREEKDGQGYGLVLGKSGSKLMEAAPLKPGEVAGMGGTTVMNNGQVRWKARAVELDKLVSMLNFQVGKPVVDATGLTGTYDIQLSWQHGAGTASAGAEGAPGELGVPLMVAIQQQLGLKLEPRKTTIRVLVVDRMERVPTEN